MEKHTSLDENEMAEILEKYVVCGNWVYNKLDRKFSSDEAKNAVDAVASTSSSGKRQPTGIFNDEWRKYFIQIIS